MVLVSPAQELLWRFQEAVEKCQFIDNHVLGTQANHSARTEDPTRESRMGFFP
jgi:hypothetical protein